MTTLREHAADFLHAVDQKDTAEALVARLEEELAEAKRRVVAAQQSLNNAKCKVVEYESNVAFVANTLRGVLPRKKESK